MKFMKSATAALAVVAAGSFATTEVEAGGHGIDLAGKTVEWVIPFSETGGSASVGAREPLNHSLPTRGASIFSVA